MSDVEEEVEQAELDSNEQAELDAEREARRLIALAQIRQYPDKVLRLPANDVTAFDEDLERLIEMMRYLMQEANGVGLAAPQVGVLQRVLVYQASEEDEVTAVVNASVVETSQETATEEEGCLSLKQAGVVVEVERPTSVTVVGQSPLGDEVRIEAEGLEARVLQHEIDHLGGILIIDRTTHEQRRAALAELREQPVLGS